MSWPETYIDSSRSGQVWLLKYSQATATVPASTAVLRSHYALLVDVAGESTVNTVAGLLLHLGVTDLASGITCELIERLGPRLRTSFLEPPLLVGTITNLHHAHLPDPRVWMRGLESAVDRWYKNFVTERGHQWSAACNCQQYVHFLIPELGLEVPAGQTFVGSEYPTLVDFASTAISTAHATRDLT